MGFMLNFNQALPYRARAMLGRLMKADSVIADADRGARAAYESRVAREVSTDQPAEDAQAVSP
jgi:hypothetical protein